MKAKLLLFTLLAALSMPAMAQSPANVCGQAQNLLSEVMDRRIEGHSAEAVYQAGIGKEQSPEFRQWFGNLIETVYSLERYKLTGNDREKVLTDFYATCIRASRGEVF